MDAAQQSDRVRINFRGDLLEQRRLVNRGRNGGAADDVRLILEQDLAHGVFIEIVRYSVDEAEIGIACLFEGTCQIRKPGGGPVARDFGAAGMILRLEQKESHESLRGGLSVNLDIRFS